VNDFADDDEDVYCWLCEQRMEDGEPCTLVGYFTDDGLPDVEMVHDHCLLAAKYSPDIMN